MCIPLTAGNVPRACVAALRQVNARVTGAAPVAHKGYERETNVSESDESAEKQRTSEEHGGGISPSESVVRAVLSTAEEVERERRIALLRRPTTTPPRCRIHSQILHRFQYRTALSSPWLRMRRNTLQTNAMYV